MPDIMAISNSLINAVIQGLGVGMGSAFGIWLIGKGVIQQIEKTTAKKPKKDNTDENV